MLIERWRRSYNTTRRAQRAGLSAAAAGGDVALAVWPCLGCAPARSADQARTRAKSLRDRESSKRSMSQTGVFLYFEGIYNMGRVYSAAGYIKPDKIR